MILKLLTDVAHKVQYWQNDHLLYKKCREIKMGSAHTDKTQAREKQRQNKLFLLTNYNIIQTKKLKFLA